MTALTITPLYAGLIGLLYLWLSIRVIGQRWTAKVSVGDGNDKELFKRIRAQANCGEYAPISLILLALVEVQGAPGWTLHLLGAAILVGRVAHAIGFGSTPQIIPLRQISMLLTFSSLALAALANIALALF